MEVPLFIFENSKDHTTEFVEPTVYTKNTNNVTKKVEKKLVAGPLDVATRQIVSLTGLTKVFSKSTMFY